MELGGSFQTGLKWGDQKEVLRLIPGLENAEVVRYGVMHRNTYLNAPKLLTSNLSLAAHPHLFVAGRVGGNRGLFGILGDGLASRDERGATGVGPRPPAAP